MLDTVWYPVINVRHGVVPGCYTALLIDIADIADINVVLLTLLTLTLLY